VTSVADPDETRSRRSGFDPFVPSVWDLRASRRAELARRQIDSGIDAIPTLESAIAALRVAAGELSPDEFGEVDDDDA
jgi:hypothetical protein